MKIRGLIAASVAILSASASADSVLYNDGNAYVGAVPVGIIVNDSLRDALQEAQFPGEAGAASDCAGETTAACMPNLNSIEVASIISTNGTQNWDDFGLPAFPAASIYSNLVLTCGSPLGDDPAATAKGATQVAVNEVGMGCSAGAFPTSKYNQVISAFVDQSNVNACVAVAASVSANLVSFAARSETLPAGFSFVKFDGSAPELANLLKGDYHMFGDVHGDAIASPHFAAAGAGVPRHMLNLTATTDNCAPGVTTTGVDLGK
ncbi:MAG: hypothetical protein CL691_01820 [Cellvibrionales bacterium]|nr:hypothetical protein [Cellvibrionales bacterium]|tara:strand:+ start:1882 stop:2670 length:789 start_codon:yes stop_codon:yes gene_type:complete